MMIASIRFAINLTLLLSWRAGESAKPAVDAGVTQTLDSAKSNQNDRIQLISESAVSSLLIIAVLANSHKFGKVLQVF